MVPESIGHGVYVLGEVAQPGPVPLPGTRRISLTDALARSGGIDKRSANASGVFVFRALPDNGVNVYQLDATDPRKRVVARTSVPRLAHENLNRNPSVNVLKYKE